MTLLHKLAHLFRNLLRQRRVDEDLDEELRSHLVLLTEEKIKAGMPEDDARRAARMELGGIEQLKEEVREQRIGHWFQSVVADCRYALRQLRKSPGFAIVAIATIALGIGANAAIFGFVDAALLRDLPFQDPDRLVHIWTTDTAGDLHTPTADQYEAILKRSASFEEVAAAGWADAFYGSDEANWRNLPALVVSSNWLRTLGVQPFLGRNFLDEEQNPGRNAVVMLSYRCWQERFRGDASVVGKQIVINRRNVTIVGVLPQSLGPYYEDIEIYAPLVLGSYLKTGNLRAGMIRVQIVTRLKPGVSIGQAASEMQVVARQFQTADTNDRSGHLIVEDFAKDFRNPGPTTQNARRGLWMMAAAAGLVLLIASANVASLLLARGVKRCREFAVRTCLGCSQGRMIRQLLTEATLLFFCGGTLGLLVARWAQGLITQFATGIVPSGTYLQIDTKVFAIGLGLCFVSALLFGLIPAISSTRVGLNNFLKESVSNVAGGVRSRRSRNLLVVTQLAMGMALLVAFGLLFRSLMRVETADLGFDPYNVVTASVRLPESRYADPVERARLAGEVVERLRLMPGVEGVGLTDSLPMEGADSAALKIELPSEAKASVEEEVWFLSVDPSYFTTLKVSLLAGRNFKDSDSPHANPVVIVNRSFADHYFPGVNPLGYHVAIAGNTIEWREIVGVTSDFKQRNPEEDSRPLVYFPLIQTLPAGRWSVAMRVRSESDGSVVARNFSNWLRPIDPQLYWVLESMQQEIQGSESLTLRRPLIRLISSFAILALLVTVVGVFGVTSYSVAERTREIGIRVALGAEPRKIASLVLKETLLVTLMGLCCGSVLAYLLAQFFSTDPIGWSGSGIFLYGVSRNDPVTFASAALLLAVTSFAAAYLPARRASRVDPLVPLHYE
jgi:predicted permease